MHVWCSRVHCLNWWIAKFFTFVVASLFAGRRDIYWIDGRVFHRQDFPIERSLFMDRTLGSSMYEGSEYHVYHQSRGSESGAQIARVTFRHVLPFVTWIDWFPNILGHKNSAPFQIKGHLLWVHPRGHELNHLADLRRWRLKGLSTSSGLHVKSSLNWKELYGYKRLQERGSTPLEFFSALTIDLWP